MDDDRHSSLFERLPRRVEDLVIGGEHTDLDVDFEQLRPGGQGFRHIVGGFGFGIEGAAVDDVGVGGGEFGVPLIQPRGHAGLVRVGQGRDGAQAEFAYGVEAGVLVEAVVDRPVAAVVVRGVVEVLPHLVEHVLRKEVDVDVGESGQAECADVGGDLGIGARGSGHRVGDLEIATDRRLRSGIRGRSGG